MMIWVKGAITTTVKHAMKHTIKLKKPRKTGATVAALISILF